MNKVILVGRLAADPEIRYTKTEKAVASFSIAVNRPTSKDHPVADFVPIVAWDKLAEICGNNLGKGQRVLVEGRLQIRSYETSDGQKRRVAEVIAQSIEFLERKKDSMPVIPGQEDPGDVNSFGKDVFPGEEIPF